MKKDGNYITEEKKKALELELEDLRGPRRMDLLSKLEYAKSLGDLSENAEYHQVREDQGKLEAQIQKIEQILKSAEIITITNSDTVQVGSKVLVQKEGTKEEKTYQIVGSEEADMLVGKISNRSPIGEALFGKKKGENVSFKTPGGVVNYKIINVF
jgi:transcription elongation factor GreA